MVQTIMSGSELTGSQLPNPARPDYKNQAVFRRNTLPARSYWIPETSLSLNGTWRFHYAANPLEAADADETFSGAWSSIQVPGHWQLQGHGLPQYTNVVYPFPVCPPNVPDENPTGTYVKTFDLPLEWDDTSHLRLRFDGVDSAYHVWLNGKFLGYAQGSRNPSEFDMSSFVHRHESNELKVRVYQWCDGSYIEDQDQWWLSGESHCHDYYNRMYLIRCRHLPGCPCPCVSRRLQDR